MSRIADAPEVEKLVAALDAAPGYAQQQCAFSDHVRSGLFEHFVGTELGHLADDPSHRVTGNTSQLHFNVVNNRRYDYVISVLLPTAREPHNLKWVGQRQLLGVTGPGSVTVKVHELSDRLDINDFRRDVEIEQAEESVVSPGEFLFASSEYEILDIVESDSVTILHSLTLKNEVAELYWTFDPSRGSTFAESAHMTTSRIKSILDIAQQMGVAVPRNVYDLIFEQGDAQLRLSAIQSLLHARDHAGFRALHRGIESSNKIMRKGSQAILDSLLS